MKIQITITREPEKESLMEFMRLAVRLRQMIYKPKIDDMSLFLFCKLNKIRCYTSFLGKVKKTTDDIFKTVCAYFSIPIELASSKSRKRTLVQARQMTMKLSKKMTSDSLKSIGEAIGGGIDHANILYGIKTANNLYDTDKKFRYDYEEIEKRLK